jgi:hypothetical protein
VDGGAQLFHCTVDQVRSGGCTHPWPAGFTGGIGSTFAISVSGDTVELQGPVTLSCTGTWTAGELTCALQASDGTAGANCGTATWHIVTQGNALGGTLIGQTLPSGEAWAGFPENNAFSALCTE